MTSVTAVQTLWEDELIFKTVRNVFKYTHPHFDFKAHFFYFYP